MFHPVRIVRRSLVPQDERGDSTMPSVVVGGFGILHALLFKGAVPALQQASLKPDFMFPALSVYSPRQLNSSSEGHRQL